MEDFPNYVWVGFDQNGEPKQVHPVKPHGDLIGFTWEMYFPASFCQKNNAAMLSALKKIALLPVGEFVASLALSAIAEAEGK